MGSFYNHDIAWSSCADHEVLQVMPAYSIFFKKKISFLGVEKRRKEEKVILLINQKDKKVFIRHI